MKLKVAIDLNPPCLTAYYQGHWAAVPLFFVPEGAFNPETGELHRIKLTILDDPVEPVDKHDSEGLQNITNAVICSLVPWMIPQKTLKELCRRFDIPIGWMTGILPKFKRKQDGLRRKARKVFPLTIDEWKKFIRHLRNVNSSSATIAETIWFLNTQLAEGGGFVTFEEILRLKVQDVTSETDHSPSMIWCMRIGFTGPSLIAHYLPSNLWEQLKKEIKPQTLFVFSDKKGVPLSPNRVERHFKKAGKLAGLSQAVVPLCLRPTFEEKALQLSVARAEDISLMDQVTNEEWALFCKHLPSLVQRRGCKSTYEPMDLLNAIFYHHRERCAFRSLPPSFPHWRAVAAQDRRWKKKGIIDAVLNLRKAMKAS